MYGYRAPLRDMRFVLFELLDADRLSELPGCADATPELIESVLEGAAKLAQEVLAPLNRLPHVITGWPCWQKHDERKFVIDVTKLARTAARSDDIATVTR